MEIATLITYALNVLEKYVPRIVQSILILIVGLLLGKMSGFIVYRMVERAGWAEPLRKTSIGRAILRSGYSPGRFMSTLFRWAIYLVALLLAGLALGIPRLNMLIDSFLTYLPSLVTGLVVFVLGTVFADTVGSAFSRAGETSSQLYNFIGNAVKIFLYFITLTIALAQMKIDVSIIYIFAQASALGLAIAIGVSVGIGVGWTFKDDLAHMIRPLLAERRRKR